MARPNLVGPVAGHDQHTRLGCLEQVAQQVQRRAVGPVEVFHDHNQRISRRPGEGVHDGRKQPRSSLVQGVRLLGASRPVRLARCRGRAARSDSRDQRGEYVAVGTEEVVRVRVLIRQAVQGSGHRPVRQRVLHPPGGGPGHHGDTARGGLLTQRSDHGRLADPRLTADHECSGVPGARPIERGAHHAELALTAHQQSRHRHLHTPSMVHRRLPRLRTVHLRRHRRRGRRTGSAAAAARFASATRRWCKNRWLSGSIMAPSPSRVSHARPKTPAATSGRCIRFGSACVTSTRRQEDVAFGAALKGAA